MNTTPVAQTTTHATPGLLTFGETMGLVSASGIGTLDINRAAHISIGGAESNVAIGVARLGQHVTWVGRVGRDAIGDLIRRQLQAEGIETHALPDDAYTGLMVRYRRTGQTVHVDYHRTGSAGSRLCPDDVPAELVARSTLLHVTGITSALSASAATTVTNALKAARTARTTVSIDVNYRSKLWKGDAARTALASQLTHADIVFAGVAEAQLVLDSTCQDPVELAHRLAGLGASEVIIKEGARGCTALIDGAVHREAALPVAIVDPVGAGDAFVAGYLAERLADAGAAQRLRTAAAMGAYAVSVPGDCELLPTRAELGVLLDREDVVR